MICFIICFWIVYLVFSLLTSSKGLPAITSLYDSEWTELFNNYEGWSGADGIYSISLDGEDAIWSASGSTKTLFIFSDTLLGWCDHITHKYMEGPLMIHNSAANFIGKTPLNNNRHFIYGDRGTMTNTSIFGYNSWLSDGIAIGNKVYIISFTYDMTMNPSRTDLITIPIGSDGWANFSEYEIKFGIPLFHKTASHIITFGAAIMDNTKVDGHVYIYGIRNRLSDAYKQMVVARVSKANFHNTDAWVFYDGKSWINDVSKCDTDSSSLFDHVSPELSVTFITSGNYKGKYFLIYEHDTLSNYLKYAIGTSPLVFGSPVVFYTTPEPKQFNNSFSYNAKAHPHISAPGTLLVSYNVNVFSLTEFPTTNEIYRPRFVVLKFE